MISLSEIENFKPKYSVVACFVEYKNQILVLKRDSNKLQGNTWCLPAGKVDSGESEVEAMTREIFEELSANVSKKDLVLGKKMFVRYPDYDYIFYTFTLNLIKKFNVVLNLNEHSEYRWVSKESLHDLDLIPDFMESMLLHYEDKS